MLNGLAYLSYERIMTTVELRNRTAPWRNARNAERRLRPGRDDAIRQALASGMTERAVAEAVDVSAGLSDYILDALQRAPEPDELEHVVRMAVYWAEELWITDRACRALGIE